MKRGEIYYIDRRNTYGSEIAKGRPAVIVSNNHLNATSGVVMVVYLTTQPKKDLPTHVPITSRSVCSTALCEQIDSVSTMLVGDYYGACTAEEMAAIDRALLVALSILAVPVKEYTAQLVGISAEKLKEETEEAQGHDPVNHPDHYTSGGIETIDFIECKGLSYHLGNAVKYITRAGKKDPTKTVEDLKKAIWYLSREVQRLEGAPQ